MTYLLPTGIVLTLIGLVGILWTILSVLRLRGAGLDDAIMRARMQRILPVNIGALMLSMLGLGLVVVATILT